MKGREEFPPRANTLTFQEEVVEKLDPLDVGHKRVLEILLAYAAIPPPVYPELLDLTPPAAEEYELRVIVWNAHCDGGQQLEFLMNSGVPVPPRAISP